jgi:hypothetical protein
MIKILFYSFMALNLLYAEATFASGFEGEDSSFSDKVKVVKEVDGNIEVTFEKKRGVYTLYPQTKDFENLKLILFRIKENDNGAKVSVDPMTDKILSVSEVVQPKGDKAKAKVDTSWY